MEGAEPLYKAKPLGGVPLRGEPLQGKPCTQCFFVQTNLTETTLTGCSIYGISVWNLKLEGAIQQNLNISNWLIEPAVTVDNLEVAQFVHLLLKNEKIRDFIDTI